MYLSDTESFSHVLGMAGLRPGGDNKYNKQWYISNKKRRFQTNLNENVTFFISLVRMSTSCDQETNDKLPLQPLYDYIFLEQNVDIMYDL